MTNNTGRTLLITGAAGRVGSFYRRWLHESGQVGGGGWRGGRGGGGGGRGGGGGGAGAPEGADEEVVAGPEIDLADLEVARRVVRGAHSVVHLAADPSPRADFYDSLLDRNVK